MTKERAISTYLEDHPNSTLADLKRKFPEVSSAQLQKAIRQAESNETDRAGDRPGSIRKQVFAFFDHNPQASMADLKQAFPEANYASIANYRYQWKHQKDRSTKKKSVKEQVFELLDEQPEATIDQLKQRLSHLNPSSVAAYQFQWKQKKRADNGTPSKKKAATAQLKSGKKSVKSPAKSSRNELVNALQETIEAQNTTIESMRKQNTLLKEKQSAVLAELEGLSDSQLEDVKRIISTYIKGLRTL